MAGSLTIQVRRHLVDVDLDLPLDPDRPVTALFGPSGAGKTTLLRCVAGLDRPAAGGRIEFDGSTWNDDRTHVPARHRNIGFLFQVPSLFPHLSVRRNVGYGLHRVPPAERDTRIDSALSRAGAADLADRAVAHLSGGEGQRVALARALAPRPQLLLLDEPLSALDAPTRRRLREELRTVLIDTATPTLLVTHDRAEVLAIADDVAVLVDGTVRQYGPVSEIFSRPADAAVAAAVDVETVLHATVVSVADGVADVAIGPRRIRAATGTPLAPGRSVLTCIRAEHVAITTAPDDPASSSPLNHLPGVIERVTPEGAVHRVDIDVGGPVLASFVTTATIERLHLARGVRVEAVVKASAVHLIPR